jgi:hypothetical protein
MSSLVKSAATFLLLATCVQLALGGIVKRADDVNADFQALQTLVQQQGMIINSLQASQTALQARVAGLESKASKNGS